MTESLSGVGSRRRAYRAPRLHVPTRERKQFSWRTVAVVLGIAVLGLYAWLWLIERRPVGVALVEIPLLLLLTGPLLVVAARSEQRFDLAGLLATGLILRFAAAYYRYLHAADGSTYHAAGVDLAKAYRNLDFGVDPGFPVPGTGGMRIVAGAAEVFTNSNEFGTYLLFAFLGFLGCYFLYQAFATALPDADHLRYGLLVFLWPTLIFWPSSIGKDCWLLLGVGLAAWGGAKVLVRRPGGYTMMVLGLLSGSFVRPHISLLFLIAFATALLVGRRAERPGSVTPGSVAKFAGIVVLVLLGALLATRTASLLNANDITTVADSGFDLSARTELGGSAFSAPNPHNPIGYVESLVTILYRPLPFEAHGTEAFVTSLETMFLFALTVASWRRLKTVPRRFRREPYVLLALVFVLVFIFAFGTLSNFGILARQRSVMMPFFFVLLSVPAATLLHRGGDDPPKTNAHDLRSARRAR
jgi:hypothetical protein